jgi:hypothetical protein
MATVSRKNTKKCIIKFDNLDIINDSNVRKKKNPTLMGKIYSLLCFLLLFIINVKYTTSGSEEH